MAGTLTRLGILAALAALAALALAERGAPWLGDWSWTLAWAAGTTDLTAPGVAAAAAWLAYRARRSAAVTDATARGRLVPLRCFATAYVLGLVVLLATSVVAAALTALSGGAGPIDPTGLVAAAAVLVPFAAAGSVAGTLLPHVLTVALIGPATFVAGAVGPFVGAFSLLRVSPPTGDLAGLRWDHAVTIGIVAFCLGCGAVLLTGTVRRPFTGRITMGLSATLGVAAIAGGVVLAGSHDFERFTPSDEAATSCAGQRIRVCLSPTHDRYVGRTLRAVERAAAPLQAAHVAVPPRFTESLPSQPAAVEGGELSLGPTPRSVIFDRRFGADAVAMPAACPQWSADTPPPETAFLARELLTEWLVQAQGGDPVPLDEAARVWLRSGTAAQLPWVSRTYDQLTTCAINDLARP